MQQLLAERWTSAEQHGRQQQGPALPSMVVMVPPASVTSSVPAATSQGLMRSSQ